MGDVGDYKCNDKVLYCYTGPGGSVADGLVGTGFASRYRFIPRAGF